MLGEMLRRSGDLGENTQRQSVLVQWTHEVLDNW